MACDVAKLMYPESPSIVSAELTLPAAGSVTLAPGMVVAGLNAVELLAAFAIACWPTDDVIAVLVELFTSEANPAEKF